MEPGLVDTRPVDSPLLSQLYQLVARQQQELQQLREEQQQVFVSLQQQLNGLQLSIVEQHHTSLAEHAREQRILRVRIVACRTHASVGNSVEKYLRVLENTRDY